MEIRRIFVDIEIVESGIGKWQVNLFDTIVYWKKKDLWLAYKLSLNAIGIMIHDFFLVVVGDTHVNILLQCILRKIETLKTRRHAAVEAKSVRDLGDAFSR